MKIAAIQVASENNVQKNVQMACALIESAAKKGAKLAVLPEEFATLGLTTKEKRLIMEPFKEGPLQKTLADCAKQHQIWLVGGTLPIKENGEKPCSSTLVWNAAGECVARYNKIHLFDVNVGKDEYRESDNVQAGETITVVETPFGKLGLAICYDLRFPELFRALMLKGAEIFVLPSAFTVPTGQAHWEILLRARAIENLCYMVAPGECGKRADNRPTFGHSMIVNPWGEVLAKASNFADVIIADIDLQKQKEIRMQFPAHQHISRRVLSALADEENL